MRFTSDTSSCNVGSTLIVGPTEAILVDVWRNGSRCVYERTDSSRLIGVEIDGEQNLPDVRPDNNRWFATKSG